jgi:anti-sigma28 factor (negative regulator of flagellin synthesis)
MNELKPTLKLVRENTVKSDSKVAKSSIMSSGAFKKPLDRVTLSEVSKIQGTTKVSKGTTSEIRHDLVNKFRNILQEGTYSIKADEIADKIVQKIRDNKNHLTL